MRVLGIDPGSQTMGWGVVEGDGRRYSLVAYGSVRAPSSMRFSARLLRMCNGIEEVIAEHRPDACALEDARAPYQLKRLNARASMIPVLGTNPLRV